MKGSFHSRSGQPWRRLIPLGCDAPDPTLFQYPHSALVLPKLDETVWVAAFFKGFNSFWQTARNRTGKNLTWSASLWENAHHNRKEVIVFCL